MPKSNIHHHSIDVKSDHLQKLSGGSSVDALSELVWNALDAEASNVSITYSPDDLGGISRLTVTDDGLGMPYDRVKEYFGHLGGSWKSLAVQTKGPSPRTLHGQDGKGRFKAFALGRVVKWAIKYKKGNEVWEYTITLISDDPKDLTYTDEVKSSSSNTGTTLTISEVGRPLRTIKGDTGFDALSQRFALYMANYPQIKIKNDGLELDPSVCIETRKAYQLSAIVYDDVSYPMEYEVVQWKGSISRAIYLCNEGGFPLIQYTPKFQVRGLNFVGYLRSNLFQKLQNENTLSIIELHTAFASVWDEVSKYTKDFRREVMASQAVSVVEQWKEEKVYPYKKDTTTPVELAERQVFDIMAVQMNEYLPNFTDADRKTKALNLQLLRSALESSPEHLEGILKEVLGLPKDKLKMLSELLEDTTLSNIISAANVVADRLVHIQGLEQLLFNLDEKKSFKERAQMQKVLAVNPWVFGEGYGLSVDDQSLTEVLRKHASLNKTPLLIDGEVFQKGSKRGIIDLMLSKAISTGQEDEIEHLVVELKSPTVTLTDNELAQIKNYAFAVAEDERFSVAKSKWDFILISNKMNSSVKRQTRQTSLPRGVIHQDEENGQRITIWVKTWAEVINENKTRMTFYKDKLELNIDNKDALARLKETYSDVLLPKQKEEVTNTQNEE